MLTLKETCAQDSPDVWSMVECGQIDPGIDADLDIMLPNGFVIAIQFSTDKTLLLLKEEVFDRAKRFCPHFLRISFLSFSEIINIFRKSKSSTSLHRLF